MIHQSLRRSRVKAAAMVAASALAAITCSATAVAATPNLHSRAEHSSFHGHGKFKTKIYQKTVPVTVTTAALVGGIGQTVTNDVTCPEHRVATGGGYSVSPGLAPLGDVSEDRPTPDSGTAKDWRVTYTSLVVPAALTTGSLTAWVVCAPEHAKHFEHLEHLEHFGH
jgi:hypothetical protein